MNEPRIAIGPPKIEARKNHLEHGLNSLRVLPSSPYLPSTPFQSIRASMTVSALKAVISTAVIIRAVPSPPVLAMAPYISSNGLSDQTTVPGRYQIPQN